MLFTYETVYNHMKRCHNISLKQYELQFKALIPLVGGKDFSRTCDINTDVTGILNDVHSANLANTADDSLAREVEAAEYADSRAGDWADVFVILL